MRGERARGAGRAERRVSRYIDEMSRDELVTEVKEFLQWGIFAHHEVGDPTVLPAAVLRRGVKRLRLRALVEGRMDAEPPPKHEPPADGAARH
jgi:hypothetical protein